MEKDPVCGMLVRPEDAAEQRIIQGRACYFCSATCAARFDQAPQRYVSAHTHGQAPRNPA